MRRNLGLKAAQCYDSISIKLQLRFLSSLRDAADVHAAEIAPRCPMSAERSPAVAAKMKAAFQFSVFRGAKRN